MTGVSNGIAAHALLALPSDNGGPGGHPLAGVEGAEPPA